MAAPIPTTEPDTLIAGDTAKWLKTLDDYRPTDGWSLSYILLNATGKITITSSASGTDHMVNVSASTTVSWPAGSYAWSAKVTHANGEAYTVASGTITVSPSFAANTLDTRSHARKTLANIEAYLENPNNLTSSMYEIAGRRLERFSIPELLKLRDRYKYEVAREEIAERVARGLPDKRRVMVRFGP